MFVVLIAEMTSKSFCQVGKYQSEERYVMCKEKVAKTAHYISLDSLYSFIGDIQDKH